MFSVSSIRKIVGAIVPSRMITTFFWIGYLPEWQSHWTAFFSIPLALLVLYFTVGFSVPAVLAAQVLLIFSLVLLFFGLIGIYLFQKTVFSESRYEITIHVAFGQCLMLALSVPAVIKTLTQIFLFNSFICAHFLNCAEWFLRCSTYFITTLVPYFVFRLIDIVKPWPSYWIERDYNNAFSNMIEGFCNAIYASALFYALNFILFNLLLVDVVEFYTQVFSGVFLNRGIPWVYL
ncbi:phosphatidylglycerophosphatase A [Neorickettsia sp. 179522]|uniref:phosphatidylglycerophosphatase A n=1 Tax=Neorickettsia sp. 179522 TaxID=1714371 RepID=UPI000796FD1E|nr:phosphatidylglycerophosphatase A [Neorickettsia sp. 179522]KYH12354.1 phosphatidylglycerophosphatase [Neorickettsia sp. 179522]